MADMSAAWFADRYEVGEELGSGNYGVVKRAYDHNLKRPVAIKFFDQGTPAQYALFEGQTLVALEGPHILKVFDAHVANDIPYLVTEIAALGSSEDQLTPFGLPPLLVIEWGRQMLVGLSVCHHHGLLHRDIKTGNLFLQREDDARLGDFGVAGRLDDLGDCEVEGDPKVLAPEGFGTGRLTIASDIYSAGATMYRLLTGVDPDRDDDQLDNAGHGEGHRHTLRDLSPHVPRLIAERVAKAMATDPADRYQSAEEMHEALARLPRYGAQWCGREPHVGHARCWEKRDRRGAARLSFCLEDGPPYRFEMRHTTGAGMRVRNGCGQASTDRELGVILRRMFKDL